MTLGVKPDGSLTEAAAAQMAITKLFGSSMLLKLSKKPETCVVVATSSSLTSTPWSFACDAVPITTVPAGQNASDSVLSAKPEPPFAGASRTVPFTYVTAPMALATFAVWAMVAWVALVASAALVAFVALVALVAFVARSALVACVAFTALVAFTTLVALAAVFACFTLSDGASFLTNAASALASVCVAVVAAIAVPPSTRLSVIIETTSAGLGRRNLRLNIRHLRWGW